MSTFLLRKAFRNSLFLLDISFYISAPIATILQPLDYIISAYSRLGTKQNTFYRFSQAILLIFLKDGIIIISNLQVAIRHEGEPDGRTGKNQLSNNLNPDILSSAVVSAATISRKEHRKGVLQI